MRGYLPILVLLGLITHFGFAQQESAPATPPPPASAIPDGEARFTPEQLEEYYLVYKNSDVRYLRTLFTAYQRGAAGKEDEFALLNKWDSEYYRSKFTVFSREDNTFGGTLITIIFQQRPDKVFIAWVYQEGQKRTLKLRALEPGKFTEEDIKRIKIRYRIMLEDKVHAM